MVTGKCQSGLTVDMVVLVLRETLLFGGLPLCTYWLPFGGFLIVPLIPTSSTQGYQNSSVLISAKVQLIQPVRMV